MGNVESANGNIDDGAVALNWNDHPLPWEIVLNVLRFVSWEDRNAAFATCTTSYQLSKRISTWRWRCRQLSAEGFYVPNTITDDGDTWEVVFKRLFQLRSHRDVHFKSYVYARFKPKNAGGRIDEQSIDVTVPLHQRLRMIKAARGCTNAEARRLLWAGSSRKSPVDHWNEALLQEPHAVLPNSPPENTTVESSNPPACESQPRRRVAPNEKEDATNTNNVVDVESNQNNNQSTGTTTASSDEVEPAQTYAQKIDGCANTGTTGGPTTTNVENLLQPSEPQDEEDQIRPAQEEQEEEQQIETDGSDSPPSAKESLRMLATGAEAGVLAIKKDTAFLCAPSVGIREFAANGMLDDLATQTSTYDTTCTGILCDWLNGLNACLFVFGQTGSGKTHTMFGPSLEASVNVQAPYRHDRGIVPRVFSEVFYHLDALKKDGKTASLQMAYVEVYGEEINNLLAAGEAVGAWVGVAARSVLNGNSSIEINTLADVEDALRQAEVHKKRAATAMNQRSSRAHSLILLDLSKTVNGVTQTSQLCLADLGGSEQLKRSGAVGERMMEAIQINVGLLGLKQCIKALNDRDDHIPYYQSNLTRLLENSLSGQSSTAVIVTCSQASRDIYETIEALRFGEMCGNVDEQALKRSSDSCIAAVAAIDGQLAVLEEEIKKKERWENIIIERQDLEGMEKQVKSVLVGAEDLRAKYDELVARKDQLLGIMD